MTNIYPGKPANATQKTDDFDNNQSGGGGGGLDHILRAMSKEKLLALVNASMGQGLCLVQSWGVLSSCYAERGRWENAVSQSGFSAGGGGEFN